MNTTMADGAEQRLDAQIAEALFGQPGMSKMDVANRVRELRGDGPALLVGGQTAPAGQIDAETLWWLQDAINTMAEGGNQSHVRFLQRLHDTLAVQPSPGGQDELIDALADDVESCVSDACGYLASDSGWGDYGIYRDDAAERYRALPDRIRALAARQPVAGLSWADYWMERGQTDVAHDFDAFSRAEAWALQRFPAARQPVVEPAMYQVRPRSFDDGEGWRKVTKREYDDRGEFPGYPEVEWERRALYATPPAQAVDLGQFRKAVEAWKRDAENRHHAGDIFPEQEDAIWKEADRLLALIDGKAVGK